MFATNNINKISLIWASIISTLLVSGCSRSAASFESSAQKNQIGEPTNAASSAQSAPGAAYIVQADGQSIVQADGQPAMGEINRVARMWMLRNNRRPTSWDDFAANAGVQIPPPPPGKKYVLSRSMHVTLEDR